MSNLHTALSGLDDSQAPPQAPASVAPPADSLSDAQQPMEIPSTATIAAGNANSLAASNPAPHAPGAWARAIMGGVVDALAGGGAAGKVPEGGGLLYGVGASARQTVARQEQQKQQALENQRQSAQMSREEAISRATIAHENAATAHDEMLTATLSSENRAKALESGKAALEPLLTAGAPIIQQGITSDEAQLLIQQKKLNPTQQHAYPTGEVPVLGPDGKPQMDKAGNPVMRNTYTVVGDVPQVTLDAATSKLISENTPYKLPEGTTMPGLVYGTLVQRAKSAQTAQMAIDQQLEEAGLRKSALDESVEAQKMKPDWNTALAKSRGDVGRALNYMQTNQQMKAKYPDAIGLVSNLYGGEKEFETVRHDQEEERLKGIQEIQDAEKNKTAGTGYEGSPDAKTPQEFLSSLSPTEQSTVELIHSGRAPLQRLDYIEARKPEILAAVEKAYPGEFDGSKVSSYQKTYQDFTSGHVAKQLQAANTAVQLLGDLQKINQSMWSRVPGSQAYKAYEKTIDALAPQLAQFYGNPTEEAVKSQRKGIGNPLSPNRDAAIRTAAHDMADHLDSLEHQWKISAPSAAYESKLPIVSDAAKAALERLNPTGMKSMSNSGPTATGPNGQKIMWNGTQWVPLQ